MTTHTTVDGLEFLRTPDERFTDLPDFPWEPHYVEIDGLRMAYLDEGPQNGAKGTVLLMHGEPTWSYLYRHMIPALVDAGHRVIAPDLIGFGRSDKPVDREAYSYAGHVAWMQQFLDHVADAGPFDTFFQDWGGLIGLRLAAETPERFRRLVIGNTGLPYGESLGAGFDFWLELSQTADPLDCGRLIDQTISTRDLTEAEIDAYRAPFPDEAHMAGVRQFPTLVPITADDPAVADNLAAREVFREWTDPVLLLWGKSDPVLGHLDADFLELIPGTNGQPHQSFAEASHFIQDDVGEPLAAAMVEWFSSVG